MKRWINLIWILTLLVGLPCGVSAEQAGAGETASYVEEESQKLSEALYGAVGGNIEAFPDFDFTDVSTSLQQGTWEWDLSSVAEQVMRLLFGALSDNIALLVKIIVIAVLAGILCNMQGPFARQDVGEIGFLACYLIIAGMMVNVFMEIASGASVAIDQMTLFMQSLIPSLIGILAAGGNAVTAATFSPTLMMTMQVATLLVKQVFLPLITMLMALCVVNSLTERFHISRLVLLCRQVVKWGLGAMLTIFVGILSLQGLTCSMADGIAGKTVKFAVGNFVPMVGGVLSDSVEAVMSSGAILRNAVGVTGVIAIAALCVGPLIQLVAIIAIYKFAAGVSEPVTDNRVTTLIGDMAGNITLVFVVLLVVTIMFVISIAMLCLVGNLGIAVRS